MEKEFCDFNNTYIWWFHSHIMNVWDFLKVVCGTSFIVDDYSISLWLNDDDECLCLQAWDYFENKTTKKY